MNSWQLARFLARLVVVATLFALYRPAALLAQQATPAISTPVVIASELLGRAVPVPVENPELALTRITKMLGAAIPPHHHPGTEIGVVIQGTLTNSIFSGSVQWCRAAAGRAPQTISAGQTVQVQIGDALIESPDSIYQGRNEGAIPVVIYLSTLFPENRPRSILDSATPTP